MIDTRGLNERYRFGLEVVDVFFFFQVRAGQWARRLIINDCLDSGTQLPYIKEAKARGFSVLVLNTNQNKSRIPSKAGRPKEAPSRKREEEEEEGNDSNDSNDSNEEEDGMEVDAFDAPEREGPIRGSRTPREHGLYVFENLVMQKKNLKRVLVVAHR